MTSSNGKAATLVSEVLDATPAANGGDLPFQRVNVTTPRRWTPLPGQSVFDFASHEEMKVVNRAKELLQELRAA